MNEFHLKHDKGEVMLYYCPFCGWAAFDCFRATFFARLSDVETNPDYALERPATRHGRPAGILVGFGC